MNPIRAHADLYWNKHLADLPKDKRSLFANKLQNCWQTVSLSLGLDDTDILIITGRKKMKANIAGKQNIESRSAKHFIKRSDRSLGELYKILQRENHTDLAVELMGAERDFKPPAFTMIINEPIKNLLPAHEIKSLISTLSINLKKTFNTHELPLSFFGMITRHRISFDADPKPIISEWIESEECTIRSYCSACECLGLSKGSFFSLLERYNKVDTNFEDFNVNVRRSLIFIAAGDLTGNLLSIPASSLDKDITKVVSRDTFLSVVSKVNSDKLVHALTTLFPSIKFEMKKVVHHYHSNHELLLSMYPQPTSGASTSTRAGFGAFDLSNLQDAVRGAEWNQCKPITLRQFVLGLTHLAATDAIKRLKQDLPVVQTTAPSTSSSSSSSSRAPHAEQTPAPLFASGLSRSASEMSVKDSRVALIRIIENDSVVNFKSLLKEINKIATEEEKSDIRILSTGEAPKQMIYEIMGWEKFTFGRLAHCLTALNAEEALHKMRDVALGMLEPSSSSQPQPSAPILPLLSSIIPDGIPFAREIKELADQFRLTVKNFEVPEDHNSTSMLEALLVKWVTEYPTITFEEVRDALIELNSPLFHKQCQEIYRANFPLPGAAEAAAQTQATAAAVNGIAKTFIIPECAICFDRRRTVINLPCGHIESCMECFQAKPNPKECSTCRAVINEAKQFFFV